MNTPTRWKLYEQAAQAIANGPTLRRQHWPDNLVDHYLGRVEKVDMGAARLVATVIEVLGPTLDLVEDLERDLALADERGRTLRAQLADAAEYFASMPGRLPTDIADEWTRHEFLAWLESQIDNAPSNGGPRHA
ncbi:MAG: hypothetical protein VX796_09225 [Pseudomonadota bacterium]|nr:hypothetical protein [Pseudomonadota bacterium]